MTELVLDVSKMLYAIRPHIASSAARALLDQLAAVAETAEWRLEQENHYRERAEAADSRADRYEELMRRAEAKRLAAETRARAAETEQKRMTESLERIRDRAQGIPIFIPIWEEAHRGLCPRPKRAS